MRACGAKLLAMAAPHCTPRRASVQLMTWHGRTMSVIDRSLHTSRMQSMQCIHTVMMRLMHMHKSECDIQAPWTWSWGCFHRSQFPALLPTSQATTSTGWTRTGMRFTRLDTDWYEIHWLDTDWYEIHKAGHGLHWLDTDWYEIYTTGHGLVWDSQGTRSAGQSHRILGMLHSNWTTSSACTR